MCDFSSIYLEKIVFLRSIVDKHPEIDQRLAEAEEDVKQAVSVAHSLPQRSFAGTFKATVTYEDRKGREITTTVIPEPTSASKTICMGMTTSCSSSSKPTGVP